MSQTEVLSKELSLASKKITFPTPPQ